MDTTTTGQNALDALRTVEFRQSLRGYDVDEVDDFLEQAAVEADQLREQLRQATAQAAQATERLRVAEQARGTAPAAPAPAPAATPSTTTTASPSTAKDSVHRMLELAERFVEQTRKDAEAEAAAVVADAQDRAKQLATDAQQRLADEVARLEGLRHRLGEDVERMSRQLESERTRISGSLHELLDWLETHLQPAAALTSMRHGTTEATEPPATPSSETNGTAPVLRLDDSRRDEG